MTKNLDTERLRKAGYNCGVYALVRFGLKAPATLTDDDLKNAACELGLRPNLTGTPLRKQPKAGGFTPTELVEIKAGYTAALEAGRQAAGPDGKVVMEFSPPPVPKGPGIPGVHRPRRIGK